MMKCHVRGTDEANRPLISHGLYAATVSPTNLVTKDMSNIAEDTATKKDGIRTHLGERGILQKLQCGMLRR